MLRALWRRAVVGLVALGMVASVAAPAGAIIGGEPDEGRHPYVGVLDIGFDDGSGGLCSGSLIAPAVVLTAAHCVSEPGQTVEFVHVSFAEQPSLDEGFFLQPPFVTGTPVVHPDWIADGFLTAPDVAVVVLDEPAGTHWPGIEPAELAPRGNLDRLVAGGTRGPRHLFTAVGYGLHDLDDAGPPAFDIVPLARRQAQVGFDELWDEIVWTQEFGWRSAVTGGKTFGDSGGALVDDDLVVGVTSFCYGAQLFGWSRARSPFFSCQGPTFGGFWRTDAPRVRDFLAGYVILP